MLLFANEEELTRLQADEYTAPAETIGNAIIAPGRLKLGELSFKEHTALVVSKGTFEADGIIGTGFLANYRYAFDLLEKKLYLTELHSRQPHNFFKCQAVQFVLHVVVKDVFHRLATNHVFRGA